MRCVSWNVAAINNNPFEYWVHSPDPRYTRLVTGVEQYITSPPAPEPTVGSVLTAEMTAQLAERMTGLGWAGVDEAMEYYQQHLAGRGVVSGFLRDRDIGSKRLASMPDRVTSAVRCADGSIRFRPSVINLYAEPMSRPAEWWSQWLAFLFVPSLPVQASGGLSSAGELLGPIKRAKYPAVTELEERISLPLQTVVLAVFDAVLLHVMNSVLPGEWPEIKQTLCRNLVTDKDRLTRQVICEQYKQADLFFLQEAAWTLKGELEQQSPEFAVLVPAKMDRKRNQNSLLMIRRALMAGEPEELTEAALALMSAEASVAPGDLLVVSVELVGLGRVLLGSFHGDTMGLQTRPVLEAVLQLANGRGLPAVLGIDANSHYKASPGKKLGVEELVQFLAAHQLGSCWDPILAGQPDPCKLPHSTFNARTYLQAQLNKAVPFAERESSPLTDRNPKDFIVCSPGQQFAFSQTQLDNSGQGTYDPSIAMPSMDFPSDHAVLSTLLSPVVAASNAPSAQP